VIVRPERAEKGENREGERRPGADRQPRQVAAPHKKADREERQQSGEFEEIIDVRRALRGQDRAGKIAVGRPHDPGEQDQEREGDGALGKPADAVHRCASRPGLHRVAAGDRVAPRCR
jgi:hypothetical protein